MTTKKSAPRKTTKRTMDKAAKQRTMVTEDDLKKLQTIDKDLASLGNMVSQLEIRKSYVLKDYHLVREGFEEFKKELSGKYGADAVIDMQTGNITRKPVE